MPGSVGGRTNPPPPLGLSARPHRPDHPAASQPTGCAQPGHGSRCGRPGAYVGPVPRVEGSGGGVGFSRGPVQPDQPPSLPYLAARLADAVRRPAVNQTTATPRWPWRAWPDRPSVLCSRRPHAGRVPPSEKALVVRFRNGHQHHHRAGHGFAASGCRS